MATSRDDLLDLSDHAWQRLRARLTGLTDIEYAWDPAPNRRTTGEGDERTVTTMSWRLNHIVDFLTEQRDATWLGLPATAPERDGNPGTAAQALDALDDAYASWRALLAASTEESLTAPIGKTAGRYGSATRRSFVLHILDELIHHGAEAALLRDLYAATQ